MGKYLLQSVILLFALEGRLGGEQNIKHNSATPDITFFSKVAFNYLGRHITDSTNKVITPHLRLSHLAGSPKIQQFEIDLIGGGTFFYLSDKHHVFEFDIAVHDVHGVEIVKAAEELLQNDFDDVLVEVLARFNKLDDRAAIAELCDNVVAGIALEDLV
jgi:hypothetical protein